MREKENALFKATGLKQILSMNNSPNETAFSYLASLPLNQFERNALILRKGKKPAVITTFLSVGALKDYNLKPIEIRTRKEFATALKKNLPLKKIGVNKNEYSAAGYTRLKRALKGKKLIDISKEIGKIRETKTKEEISKISKAVKITQNALKQIPQLYKKGMSERELAVKLECNILENGADTTSFPVIVASGKSGRTPHHITSKKKIGPGFLLIDFGARFEGYCADISRTFFVGKPKEKERELYELVFEAKKAAEKSAAPGVTASALFKSADDVLREKGWKMTHALGHGVGLHDHDFPAGISSKSKWALEEKMCLAIEPAIYGEFGGIRLEDNYTIGKKLKKLSQAPRELILLK